MKLFAKKSSTMSWILNYLFFASSPVHALTVNRLDEYYSSLTKMQQFSGFVLYYKNGKKQFSKAYGQASQDKNPLTFRVGSISKPITATAVLSLVEKKKLALDTPVNQILKDLNIPDTVTVRNLLNQTSGALYEFGPEVKTEADFRIALKKMSWNKSGKWTYSNIGYQTLGLLVKEVTKEPLYSYIEKNVFSRLTPPDKKNLVQGLNNDCGNVSTIKHIDFYDVGSGGVIASPEVIADFFIALNENKILSPSSKKSMFADPGQDGYGFGMNVKNVDGNVIYSHNGSLPGFKSFIMFNEKNEFLFVFNNFEQFPIIQAQKDATLALTGKDFKIPAPVNRVEKPIDTKPLMDFVGKYVLDFDANQTVKISYNPAEKYFYILDEGKERKLIPESSTSFFTCPTNTDTVYFKRENNKIFLELTALGGAKFTASRKN